MNQNQLDFPTLNARTACFDTFAYWLGILSDPSAPIALDAEEACSAMSYQFDCEEQAVEEKDLCGYPEIIPGILQPVAPVTLALRWSPFPSAIAALGAPVNLHQAGPGQVVAVFHPVENPAFAAETADQRHFLHLLQQACHRAKQAQRQVFLAGSPGWSYGAEDFIAGDRKLARLMKKFGFVAFARKPKSV